MKTFLNNLEIIIIGIIAILSILISILDFVGALNSIPWMSQRIHIMTLLTVGTVTLYLLSQRKRNITKLEVLINKNHKDIIESIRRDEDEKQIIEVIRDIWRTREDEIEAIFEKVVNGSVYQNRDSVLDFLRNTESSFDRGEVFELKLSQPWDINIYAINYKGVRLYHQHENLISTKPRSPQHPIWKILERRNGRLLWENFLSGKLSDVNNFPFNENLRLTMIYFRDVPRLEMIVIVESHINILPNLIKP